LAIGQGDSAVQQGRFKYVDNLEDMIADGFADLLRQLAVNYWDGMR
jgi:hypothetical protein